MRVKKSGILTILCAICSWISQAVAFELSWKRNAQRTSSLCRSISGILSASTNVWSTASSFRAPNYLNMVATTGRGGKEMASVWMLPAWLPTSLFGAAEDSSPLRRAPAMEPVLEEIRSAGVDNGYMKATASMRNLAGYMDYDPKTAAKSAYKTGYKAGMKREGSWFSM